LVISDTSVIELSSDEDDSGPMLFTVDGRDSVHVEPGDRIEVCKAARSFHLLRLEGWSFYDALRQKLGWQGM
jgi:NAD+ kinase